MMFSSSNWFENLPLDRLKARMYAYSPDGGGGGAMVKVLVMQYTARSTAISNIDFWLSLVLQYDISDAVGHNEHQMVYQMFT